MAFVNASAKVHGDKYEFYSFSTPDVCLADFALGDVLRHDEGCKWFTEHSVISYSLAYYTDMELYVCRYLCVSGGRIRGQVGVLVVGGMETPYQYPEWVRPPLDYSTSVTSCLKQMTHQITR